MGESPKTNKSFQVERIFLIGLGQVKSEARLFRVAVVGGELPDRRRGLDFGLVSLFGRVILLRFGGGKSVVGLAGFRRGPWGNLGFIHLNADKDMTAWQRGDLVAAVGVRPHG